MTFIAGRLVSLSRQIQKGCGFCWGPLFPVTWLNLYSESPGTELCRIDLIPGSKKTSDFQCDGAEGKLLPRSEAAALGSRCVPGFTHVFVDLWIGILDWEVWGFLSLCLIQAHRSAATHCLSEAEGDSPSSGVSSREELTLLK